MANSMALVGNTLIAPTAPVRMAGSSLSVRPQVSSTTVAVAAPDLPAVLRRRISPPGAAAPRLAARNPQKRSFLHPSPPSPWRPRIPAAAASASGGASGAGGTDLSGQVPPNQGVSGPAVSRREALTVSAVSGGGLIGGETGGEGATGGTSGAGGALSVGEETGMGGAVASVEATRASRHRPGQMEFVPGQRESYPTRKTFLAFAAAALLLFLNRQWLLQELLCSSLLILSLFAAACGSTAVFFVFLAHSLLLLLPDPILTPLSTLLSLIASGAQFTYFALLAQFDIMPVGPVVLNCLLVTAVVTAAQRFESKPESLNGPLWLAGAAGVALVTGVVPPLVFLIILTLLTGVNAARAAFSASAAAAAAASSGSSSLSPTSTTIPNPLASTGPNWLSVVAPAAAAVAGAAESLVVRLLAVGVFVMLAVWLHHSGRISLQKETTGFPGGAVGPGRMAAKKWKLEPLSLVQGLVVFAGLVAVMRGANSAFLSWMML